MLENPGLVLTALVLTIALNVVIAYQDSQGVFPAAGHRRAGGHDARAAGRIVSGDERGAAADRSSVIKSRSGGAERDWVHGRRGATNTGNIFVILKPLEQRKVSAAEVINRLRPKLNQITGASTFLQASQDIRIGGRGATRCTSTRSRRTT